MTSAGSLSAIWHCKCAVFLPSSARTRKLETAAEKERKKGLKNSTKRIIISGSLLLTAGQDQVSEGQGGTFNSRIMVAPAIVPGKYLGYCN